MSGPSGPKLSGNTSVTVVMTSTANDQLAEFDLGFQSITLTSQSGKTVTLDHRACDLGPVLNSSILTAQLNR